MSDGALHAQVDCHWPVPRVMPAAMRAPTLLNFSSKSPCSERTRKNRLVKVIEQTQPPCAPPAWKRLGKIHRRRDTGDRGTKAEDDPGDDEHGDVLSGSLEDYPEECEERADENGRSTAQPVGQWPGYQRTEEAADED